MTRERIEEIRATGVADATGAILLTISRYAETIIRVEDLTDKEETARTICELCKSALYVLNTGDGIDWYPDIAEIEESISNKAEKKRKNGKEE